MWPKDLNIDTPYTNEVIQTFQDIKLDIPILVLPRCFITFQYKPRSIKNNNYNPNIVKSSNTLCNNDIVKK